MRRVDRAEAREVLHARQEEGHNVNPSLLREVDREGEMFLLRLEDEAAFLSLIWLQSSPVRLLALNGRPRTLRDVGERLLRNGHTFESLSQDMGLRREQHHPEWFEPCVRIDRHFDYGQFGWVAVVASNNDEQRDSRLGSFYLFDGMHKTLVLAKRLLRKETIYQPVDALYLVPRRW